MFIYLVLYEYLMVGKRKKRVFTGPAPLWKRFLSFFIDLLVLEVFVFSHFESLVQPYVMVPSQDLMRLSFLVGTLGFFVLLYFSTLEYTFGQTLGDMAVGIKLLPQPISLWRIVVSDLSFLPFFPFLFLAVLDFMMLFFSSTHQRFMRLLVGIQVVEEYTIDNGGVLE